MKKSVEYLLLALVVGTASVEAIIDEDFNGGSTPAGWVGHTYSGGDHGTEGTALGDDYRFPNAGDDGYLRLTQDSAWQRSTMIYTNQTMNTRKDFSFTTDVRIQGSGSGADGMAFFWMSKDSVDQVVANDSSVSSVADISGGYGEWEGVPHGTTSGHLGYYEGISGYSFEFDHYKNTGEFQEYNHFIRIDDWDHSAGSVAAADRSDDDAFFYNDGWVRTFFEFDAETETFSYYLESLEEETLGEVSETTSFSIADLESATGETGWYEQFDEAYFGIGASTGGASAEHLVDNLSVIPEPSSILLLVLAVGAGAFIRRILVM